MKPSDVAQAAVAIIPTRQALYVEGQPGIGKSSLIFQAAASVFDGASIASAVGGFPQVPWFFPFPATDRDVIDVRGIMHLVDGETKWSPSDILTRMRQSPEGGVFCIEELAQAVPLMQCVLREPLLNRTIGGVPIPDNWMVCGTGNRQEDRAGAGRLLSHVASSVIMLTLEVSEGDWQRWAVERAICPEVRSYIRWKPDQLWDFNPARKLNADPRGWERLSNIFHAIPERLRFEVFSGTVGEGPAGGFIDYLLHHANLPKVDDILADPSNAPVPSEASVRYALSGAIVERCRDLGKPATFEAAAIFTGRFPAEVAMKTFLDLQTLDPRVVTSRPFVEFLHKHPELMGGMG